MSESGAEAEGISWIHLDKTHVYDDELNKYLHEFAWAFPTELHQRASHLRSHGNKHPQRIQLSTSYCSSFKCFIQLHSYVTRLGKALPLFVVAVGSHDVNDVAITHRELFTWEAPLSVYRSTVYKIRWRFCRTRHTKALKTRIQLRITLQEK